MVKQICAVRRRREFPSGEDGGVDIGRGQKGLLVAGNVFLELSAGHTGVFLL